MLLFHFNHQRRQHARRTGQRRHVHRLADDVEINRQFLPLRRRAETAVRAETEDRLAARAEVRHAERMTRGDGLALPLSAHMRMRLM